MSKWIKCSDRLPSVGDWDNPTFVLVIGTPSEKWNCKVQVATYESYGFCIPCDRDDHYLITDVTHWSPIPESPNETNTPI